MPDSLDWESVPYCEIGESDKDRFLLRAGDIVVARTGATVGYAKLIRDEVDAVFASYLVRFRVDPAKANPQYVGRLLESNVYKAYVKSRVGGAAQPNASAPVLGGFRFSLPPGDVQARVADMLSAYDDLIENNRRRMGLLEEAARQLYCEWFVRLRFPGREHTRIIDGVPGGWEQRKIAEVCDTVGGGTPSTKVSNYWDGDITWIVPSDVTKNDCIVLLESERRITESGLRESSAKLVPAWTILMTSRASVGFFALMDKEACTNQGFINIVPHDPTLRIYLFFNLMHRVEEIRANAKGSTYPEISKGRFREMDVIIPAGPLLKAFNSGVLDCVMQVRCLKEQNQKLRAVRDLLLPRLMSGKMAV